MVYFRDAMPERPLGTARFDILAAAGVLLEGLSAETKGFVDAKLRELATEKRRLQHRLEELEAAPYDPIDPDAALKEGLASIRELPRLLETGSPEDRKGFVRAFIAGITVVPESLRLDLQVRRIPATSALARIDPPLLARNDPPPDVRIAASH